MVGSDMMARTMMDFHPRLRRGDAFLHNSPYHGCSHAADLSVLVPVIDDGGVHRFTVLAKAHQADIGNSVPTTYMASARDVYEEGALIFAATKVQENYEDIDDIVRMCMMRIRVPEQWRGDYLAGVGAARIGERDLLALGADVGWDTLEAHVGAWFDYSEQRMIAALTRLPSGRTAARSVHDPFPGTPPEGVSIKATVRGRQRGGANRGRPHRQPRLHAMRVQRERGLLTVGRDGRHLQQPRPHGAVECREFPTCPRACEGTTASWAYRVIRRAARWRRRTWRIG